MTKQEFIDEIAKYVAKYASYYGILVYSPIIAQACLESAYGTSYKASHHNYFGLKYRANRVTCNTGYFEDGGSEQNANGSYTMLPSSTSWYRFANIELGVKGYFEFTNIANYKNLKGVSDPLTYLELIKKDGYATSIDYVKNVFSVIQYWNLTKYDPILKDGKIVEVVTNIANSVASTINNTLSSVQSSTQTKTDNSKYKVAIDSGHGSDTPGKRSPDGYREHWSNTLTAFYLDQILTKNGFKTYKSSWDDDIVTNDPNVELATRQARIKGEGCNISISIHANAFGDGKTFNNGQGVETYYHSTPSKAADSKRLADLVQAELIKGSKQTNRKVKTSNFAMCNCTAMNTIAAVLIETAFMTNEYEAQLLRSDDYMRECAREIAQGIFNYFGVNGNVNVPLTKARDNYNTLMLGAPREEVKEEKPVEVTKPVKLGTAVDRNSKNQYGYTEDSWNKMPQTVKDTIIKTYQASHKNDTVNVQPSQSINNKKEEQTVNNTVVTVNPNTMNRSKKTYTVKRGDNLSKIAAKVKVTWKEIAELNNISAPYIIRVNQILDLPDNAKIVLEAGSKLELSNVNFYRTSVSTEGFKRTGTYFLWNEEPVHGRYRVTNAIERVGIPGQVSGWVNESDLI